MYSFILSLFRYWQACVRPLSKQLCERFQIMTALSTHCAVTFYTLPPDLEVITTHSIVIWHVFLFTFNDHSFFSQCLTFERVTNFIYFLKPHSGI